MRFVRVVESSPARGAPDFLPASVGVDNAGAAGVERCGDGGLDGGVGVPVEVGGEGPAWVPAYEVGKVPVGIVLGVDVELPFLDLGPGADVQAFVEFGEGVRDGLDEGGVVVGGDGGGLEGCDEDLVDELLPVRTAECGWAMFRCKMMVSLTNRR